MGCRQEALCVWLSIGVYFSKYYCSTKVPRNTRTLPLKHQKGFCEPRLPSPQPTPCFLVCSYTCLPTPPAFTCPLSLWDPHLAGSQGVNVILAATRQENWTALRTTESSHLTHFFLLLVMWYRACSALWADMLAAPQGHSSVAQHCQYVFERGSFLYAPQAYRRQGEDSLPLPHPIPLFSQALLINGLGILGGNIFSVNSFFCLPPLCSQEWSQKKAVQKKLVSLALRVKIFSWAEQISVLSPWHLCNLR